MNIFLFSADSVSTLKYKSQKNRDLICFVYPYGSK